MKFIVLYSFQHFYKNNSEKYQDIVMIYLLKDDKVTDLIEGEYNLM